MLQELLENAGYEPYAYSGRGMYGKQCIAVTSETIQDVFQKLLAAAIEYGEEAAIDYLDENEIFASARWDNMGTDYVVYWPYQEWTEDEPDTD